MTAPRLKLGSTHFASDGIFRSAFESSPDCVKILDLEGVVQFINRNGAALLGAEDIVVLLGAPWVSLWEPLERPMVAAALAAAAAGEQQRFTGAARIFTGELRYFDNVLSPLVDNAGATSALLVTSRDVTETEAARLAAESRERLAAQQTSVLRAAAEMAKLASWGADFRRGVLVRSEESNVLLRGGLMEAPIQRGFGMYEPDVQRQITALIERVRTHGEQIKHEAPFIRHDGTRGWVRLRGEPVYEGEECVGLTGTAMDISEQKAAEETLRRAERRLACALGLAGMHVYELDFEARTLIHEGEGELVFETQPTFDDLWPDLEVIVHPEDRARASAEWAAALADGTPFRSEFRVSRSDDRELWIFCVAEILVDAAGEPTRLIAALVDITERKRGEIETLQAIARMREHEDRQKLLLDELNHRVKNTLASVQSVAVQSLRDARDLRGARDLFIERLMALSSTHNLLVKRGWEGATLHELAEMTLRPYGHPYIVHGPDLKLDPNFAVSLGMALHELATNALKHGAWQAPGGNVELVVEPGTAEATIVWREVGGPPVAQPTRRGFGSRLLERGVARELGGQVSLEFDPAGVVCAIRAPLSERLRVIVPDAT